MHPRVWQGPNMLARRCRINWKRLKGATIEKPLKLWSLSNGCLVHALKKFRATCSTKVTARPVCWKDSPKCGPRCLPEAKNALARHKGVQCTTEKACSDHTTNQGIRPKGSTPTERVKRSSVAPTKSWVHKGQTRVVMCPTGPKLTQYLSVSFSHATGPKFMRSQSQR